MAVQPRLDAFWGARRQHQSLQYSGQPLPEDLFSPASATPRKIVCVLGGPGARPRHVCLCPVSCPLQLAPGRHLAPLTADHTAPDCCDDAGSGKTTQCAAAATACGYTHICVGQLLKQEASDDRDEVKACMAAGTLVPTATVVRVLERALQEVKGPVLLDGFPRVAEQIEVADTLGTVAGVVFLDCSEDVMLQRMNKTDADSDEIALIAQFTEHCLPCIDEYEQAGLVHLVNAGQGVDEVQSSLQSTLAGL